jgi:hypothetical protein
MSWAGECALANLGTSTEPRSGHVGSLLQTVFSPSLQHPFVEPSTQLVSGVAGLTEHQLLLDEAGSWKRTAEILGGVVLILGLVVICYHHCKGRNANEEDAPALTAETVAPPLQHVRAPRFSNMNLAQEKCDFALGFPHRCDNSAKPFLSGIDWDAEVDGLQYACRIFRDPNKNHHVTEEELQQEFTSPMKFEAYHNAVCQLLLRILSGPHFGLHMTTFPSVDYDEVFLTLRLPRAGDALSKYAAHFSYSMPVSDAAYETIEETVLKDTEDNEVRAYAQYLLDRQTDFELFRQADKLRLIRAQMEKYINLNQMMVQKVLSLRFPAHYWKEVVDLSQDFGNPWYWYRMPDRNHEDRVRDYYGEEVAWMFVWQACYVRALLIPACIGTLVYFRRFFMDLSGSLSHEVQLAYAAVMMFWAAFFNGWFRRREVRLRQRWGMERYSPPIAFRDEYESDLDGSVQVYVAMVASDLLALALLCFMVLGNHLIHKWQMTINKDTVHFIWHWVGSLLITLQIVVIDKFWFWCSFKINEKENHTSREKWISSWARKIFMVRIINNLYPFLYTGFLKEHYEGCPDFEAGCLGELQANLCVFFMVWILKVVGKSLVLVIFLRWQVAKEIQHKQDGRDYTYIELQAKCQEYDDALRMDDWTESVLSFAFLACFNVVLPAVAPIALLTNLLRMRCEAYRNLHFLQRPVPRGASGTGAWQYLCEIVEVIAVIVNVSFAVFTMAPIRDFNRRTKWVLFVAIQYAAFLLQLLVKAKVPDRPREIEDNDVKNQTVIRKVFLDSRQHEVINLTRSTFFLPALGSRVYDVGEVGEVKT